MHPWSEFSSKGWQMPFIVILAIYLVLLSVFLRLVYNKLRTPNAQLVLRRIGYGAIMALDVVFFRLEWNSKPFLSVAFLTAVVIFAVPWMKMFDRSDAEKRDASEQDENDRLEPASI